MDKTHIFDNDAIINIFKQDICKQNNNTWICALKQGEAIFPEEYPQNLAKPLASLEYFDEILKKKINYVK